jgi:hypothetical protein
MDTQNHVQTLRLHLLDMAKLSQRAVDYATKGYKLGSPEFCRYVRRGDSQLGELRRRITALCQQLKVQETALDPEALHDGPVLGPEVRFPLSALRICNALYATCTAAAEIAHHTMLLLEDARIPGCEALQKICHLVNRMMCLCIIALFKSEIQHAETVLQNQEAARLLEQAYGVELLSARISFYNLRDGVTRETSITAALELAIANSLKQIANQAREIAEAIVFWLQGRRCVLEPSASAR